MLNVDQSLNDIENKIEKEHYNEALNLLQYVLNRNFLAENKLLLLKAFMLKSKIYFLKGRYFNALDQIESALENTLLDEKSLELLDALLIQEEILWSLGDLNQSWDVLQQSENILNSLENKYPNIELFKRLCIIKLHRGVISAKKGDLLPALEFALQGLSLAGEIGTGNLSLIGWAHKDIGYYYYEIGELNPALSHCQKALTIWEQTGKIRPLTLILNLIGLIKFQQNNLDKAMKFFHKSFVLQKELGNPIELVDTLMNLIQVHLKLSNNKAVNNYLKRLNTIVLDFDNNKILLQKKEWIYALVLKNSSNFRDKFQALEKFDVLAHENTSSDFSMKISSLLHYCDLLLFELEISEQEDILQPIKEVLLQLEKIAEDEQSTVMQAQFFLLKAKVYQLEFNLEKSQIFIQKALALAIRKDLKNLTLTLTREYEKMLKQTALIKSFQKKLSWKERLQLFRIGELFNHITDKQLTSQTAAQPDIPLMLLIFDKGGILLYKIKSTLSGIFDDDFLGPFLTALDGFSKEVFASSLELIQLNKFRVLLNFQDPIRFCYVFQGESYSALKRLNHFIQILQLQGFIWRILKIKGKIQRPLSKPDISQFNNFFIDTFFSYQRTGHPVITSY